MKPLEKPSQILALAGWAYVFVAGILLILRKIPSDKLTWGLFLFFLFLFIRGFLGLRHCPGKARKCVWKGRQSQCRRPYLHRRRIENS